MILEFLALISGLVIGSLSTGTKSQFVRLIDIIIFGPALIIVGFYLHNLSSNILVKLLLIFMGAGIITYNLKNYIAFNKN